MSSRIGIVLQAIVVIALGSIVYLAFLSPEDPDPLTGIEVENGVRITPSQVTGGRRHDDPGSTRAQRRRHHHDPEDRKRKRKRNRPRRSATLPRLVATPPPSSAVPLPAAKPVVTAPIDTPSGSQYADGVARIVGMVGRAQH